MIDDGEVPLAPLPKTGNPVEASGLMLLISGMVLAAYAAFAKKQEEE